MQAGFTIEQWAGITQLATLEPKPGIPASSSYLARLLTNLKKTPADFILYASYQNGKAAHWLSDKLDIPAVSVDLGPDKNESLIAWFDRVLMQLTGIE